MANNRSDALTRSLATSRRSAVVGVIAGLGSQLLRGVVARARPQQKQNGDPLPVPPKCSKLNGKCAFNGDCCGTGTRCKRIGNSRKCRCKVGRSPCAGNCCPIGGSCCGRCADLQSDVDHCGACFTACAADETCIAGVCTA
jgi:hypothetical protein